MLNLRQLDDDPESLHTNEHATMHRLTIRFNTSSIVGNMGKSLQFGAHSQNDSFVDEVDKNLPIPLLDLSASTNLRLVNCSNTDIEVSKQGNTIFQAGSTKNMRMINLECLY
jgi:hypothetical protein